MIEFFLYICIINQHKMKNIILALLFISGLTSCLSTNTPVVNTTSHTSNKVKILPYEDYIYNGVRLMNTGDTLYLDPQIASKVK